MSFQARWTPRAVWRRSTEVLHKEGPGSLAVRVAGELFYRRMVLMLRPFDLTMRDVEPLAKVQFRELDPSDVDAYLELRPDADPSDILKRLHARHVCYGAFRSNELVQACWIATERAYIDYLRAEIRLPPAVGYLYDLYTAPAERGLSLHRAMWPHVFRYFSDMRPRYVLAAFQPENRVQRIFARLGFRPVGVLGYVGVGRARRVFYRGEPVLAAPPRRARAF